MTATVTRRSVASSEFITVTVSANVDPTSDAVAIAVAALDVTPTSWLPAVWAGVATGSAGAYAASARTTSVVALAAGTYKVWAKITDNPEIPVVLCGYLVVS